MIILRKTPDVSGVFLEYGWDLCYDENDKIYGRIH